MILNGTWQKCCNNKSATGEKTWLRPPLVTQCSFQPIRNTTSDTNYTLKSHQASGWKQCVAHFDLPALPLKPQTGWLTVRQSDGPAESEISRPWLWMVAVSRLWCQFMSIYHTPDRSAPNKAAGAQFNTLSTQRQEKPRRDQLVLLSCHCSDIIHWNSAWRRSGFISQRSRDKDVYLA